MSLKLSYGYPKYLLSVFNIQPSNLHAIFNSYTGKKFIFHDKNYYRKINECTFTAKLGGYILEVFPRLSSKIDSAFRLTDVNLYFCKNGTVYLYNELN